MIELFASGLADRSPGKTMLRAGFDAYWRERRRQVRAEAFMASLVRPLPQPGNRAERRALRRRCRREAARQRIHNREATEKRLWRAARKPRRCA